VLDELTDTKLSTNKRVQEYLEGTNAEISSLRKLSKKQRLAIVEYKHLLSRKQHS